MEKINVVEVLKNRETFAISDPTEFEQLVLVITTDVMKKLCIKTIDNEPYFFEHGIFSKKRNEKFLFAWVENEIKDMGYEDKYSTKLANEVLFHVKNQTYVDPEEIEKNRMIVAFNNGYLDFDEFLRTGNISLQSYETIEETEITNENGEVEHKNKIVPIKTDTIVYHKIPITIINEPALRSDSIEEIAKTLCPRTYKFFCETVGPELAKLQFEKIGYAMLPANPLEKAFMEVGNGANGKTTFLNLVSSILGDSEYNNIANLTLYRLSQDHFAAAELYHKLANICGDMPSEAIKFTGTFKMLTGEDTIGAPRKYKESLSFKSYATPFFAANQLPDVEDDSHAWWRRWIVTEYPNTFTIDINLPIELEKEKDITATIALYALFNLMKTKQFSVKSESDFKEIWKRRADSVYAFIKEGLESNEYLLDTHARIEKDILYDEYVESIDAPVVKSIFSQKLISLFGIKIARDGARGNRKHYYIGIGEIKRNEGLLDSVSGIPEHNARTSSINALNVVQKVESWAGTPDTNNLSQLNDSENNDKNDEEMRD